MSAMHGIRRANREVIMEPVVPDPPNTSPYGMGELALFPRLTREQFEEMYNQQAPPFDSTRKIKLWAFTTVDGPYTYTGFDERTGKFTIHTMSELEARSFNLPGNYNYLQWAPVTGATKDGAALPAILLSTRVEADAIAGELSVAFSKALLRNVEIRVNNDTLMEAGVSWNNEERRIYTVQIPEGGTLNVGHLLRQKYQRGVGAPGHWRVVQNSLQWIIDPEPTGAGVEEVEMPYRNLREDEQEPTQTPWGWVIYKKDEQPPDDGDGALVTGGFTESDREKLNWLYSFFKR